MSNRRNQSRGFSLIELMVVVAIIAALAAILIPVVSKGKARAARAGCISNLKQMAVALSMYLNDWNGTMPWRMGYEGGAGGGYFKKQTGWTSRLRAYNDAVDLFRCPADNHFFSYGMNAQVMGKAKPPVGYDEADKLFKQSDVVCPTKVIVIYDAPGSGDRQAGGGGDVEQGDSDLTNEGQGDGAVYGDSPKRNNGKPITHPDVLARYFHTLYFPGRHDGGNNLLFWDGHAKWFYDWDWRQMTFDPKKKPIQFFQ